MTTKITMQNNSISKILSFNQKESLDESERYFVCTGSLTNYLIEIFTTSIHCMIQSQEVGRTTFARPKFASDDAS